MNKEEALQLFYKYQDFNVYDENQMGIPELNEQFYNKLFEKYNETTGKKTKSIDKVFQSLDKEIIDQIREPFSRIVTERFKNQESIKQEMKNDLKEFSKTYVVEKSGILSLIKRSNSSTFSSQGFGASKYAKAQLKEPEMLLNLFGFATSIRESNTYFNDRWGVKYYNYELWSNITPFDYYMFKEQGHFISVLNWAVLCWQNGTNPKVYFPYLSDKDYERSLQLWREGFIITKENCMLENYE